MKILYITTIGATMGFFKSFIQELVNDGHAVDIACNETLAPVAQFFMDLGCKQYHLDCTRSPFAKGNITCVKQIKKLVEENQYDIVHCHTPIAAACTRLACRGLRKKRKNTEHPLRVFYTAHGFHFYKGAPKKNWIIYYPIEWLCAHWTDVLITINKEDLALAQKKFSFGGKCRIEYVPGMGVDIDRFANVTIDRSEKRKELGVPEDAFLMVSAGELNENKNHQIVVKAMAKVNNPNIYYLIAGEGGLKGYLENLADSLNLKKNVKLLGYRTDLAEIYKAADLCVFPSIREGLGLAALEGMAAGLPLLCSDNRGTRDYAFPDGENTNAYLADCFDEEGFTKGIEFFNSCSNIAKYGKNAQEESKRFTLEKSLMEMKRIYNSGKNE